MIKQKMTQYTVPVKNEPEAVHRMAQLLGREGICMTGIMTQTVGELAVVRFLADTGTKLVRRPLEQAGYEVFEHPCFQLELSNRPGEFSRVTKALAEENVQILNCYGMTCGEDMGKLVLVVDRPERVHMALNKQETVAA